MTDAEVVSPPGRVRIGTLEMALDLVVLEALLAAATAAAPAAEDAEVTLELVEELLLSKPKLALL